MWNETSDLCSISDLSGISRDTSSEISDLFLYVSYFAYQSKGIKFGD